MNTDDIPCRVTVDLNEYYGNSEVDYPSDIVAWKADLAVQHCESIIEMLEVSGLDMYDEEMKELEQKLRRIRDNMECYIKES